LIEWILLLIAIGAVAMCLYIKKAPSTGTGSKPQAETGQAVIGLQGQTYARYFEASGKRFAHNSIVSTGEAINPNNAANSTEDTHSPYQSAIPVISSPPLMSPDELGETSFDPDSGQYRSVSDLVG
jgi:hypothetical protein